jgi:methionyl-tRNA synthetase
VLTRYEKWFDNEVPEADDLEQFAEVRAELEQLLVEYDAAFEREKSQKDALQKALEIARLGDQFLQEEEPWNEEENREEVLRRCLEIAEAIAVTFYPFIPGASERVWNMLGLEEIVSGGDRLEALASGETFLEPGNELGDREILFEKVDAETLAEQVDGGEEDETGDVKMADEISFEEFQELDIRIGTIVSVEEHPNADKLYLLQIDIGGETRQSCAGLVDHYEPEDLEGRTVVVLVNLETSELRGGKSECIVLAAEDENGNVVLLEPSADIGAGAGVK